MLYHIGIIISVCLCIRGTYVCFCLRIYGRRLHIFVPTRLSMVVFTNAHSVDRAFLCCILQLCWATLNYSFWAGVKYSRSISFLKKASTWKKPSITITINEIRTVLYTKFHSQSQPVVWFSGIFERCRLLEPHLRSITSRCYLDDEIDYGEIRNRVTWSEIGYGQINYVDHADFKF